jgi:hypothetical protein
VCGTVRRDLPTSKTAEMTDLIRKYSIAPMMEWTD